MSVCCVVSYMPLLCCTFYTSCPHTSAYPLTPLVYACASLTHAHSVHATMLIMPLAKILSYNSPYLMPVLPVCSLYPVVCQRLAPSSSAPLSASMCLPHSAVPLWQPVLLLPTLLLHVHHDGIAMHTTWCAHFHDLVHMFVELLHHVLLMCLMYLGYEPLWYPMLQGPLLFLLSWHRFCIYSYCTQRSTLLSKPFGKLIPAIIVT